MNGRTPDQRLDALLCDLPAAPPVPAGLAARVLAAAAGAVQEPRAARARRSADRRDRRGRWLRRPLLAGTAALGLIVTSAVAATLAGVPIPQKIAAVFFPDTKAPEPVRTEAPRRVVRPATAPAARPIEVAKAEPAPEPTLDHQPGPWRRLARIQRIVDARRAMGLPTPGADRLERRLRRRAEMWERATPEQRAHWLQRQQERRAARQAALATPEAQAALAAQREQMRRWRAQRQAGIPLTPEQRAERREMVREWRARGFAGVPPTPEERMARQSRFRQWQGARRARWQARDEAPDGDEQASAEAVETAER
jgi:hypothetical protein